MTNSYSTTTDTTVHRADVGDTELAYWDRGAGETILLVHSGVIGDGFAPVFDEPALDGFRVVRMHRAGYGRSPAPGGPLSFADHARHCCALLRGLGISSATWVGHSSSACIGLQAALDEPELITRLVLLEPAPQPAGPASAQLFETVVAPAIGAVRSGDAEGAVDIFLCGVSGDGWHDVVRERLGDGAVEQVIRDSVHFFTTEAPAGAAWGFGAEQAARVTAPTLLVRSGESPRQTGMFHETIALLGGMLPAAETVELPGVGHGMALGDPAGVARLVAGFVRRHR